MLYELINPHDRYTFEAPTARVAALLCLAIGGGSYGADAVSGAEVDNWSVHLFSSEGELETEFRERWDASLSESLKADRDELAKALRSLMIASVAERVGVAAALDACPTPEARSAFLVAYHDKARSSMTDLVRRARTMADSLQAT